MALMIGIPTDFFSVVELTILGLADFGMTCNSLLVVFWGITRLIPKIYPLGMLLGTSCWP